MNIFPIYLKPIFFSIIIVDINIFLTNQMSYILVINRLYFFLIIYNKIPPIQNNVLQNSNRYIYI